MGHLSQRIKIEPLNSTMLQAVAALEKECFSNPWSLKNLRAELSNPAAVFYTARLTAYAPDMPEYGPGRIAGYVGMHHILDEGFITNIAVKGEFRRMGIAAALMRAIFDYGHKNALRLITLEVRPSNAGAISMYKKFGFQQEGRRKDYYHAPAEDALILTAYLEYQTKPLQTE